VNGVKGSKKLSIQRQCISLDESERIVRLRFDIDADNLESGKAVSDGGPASAAE
jgi:hypothetical protein